MLLGRGRPPSTRPGTRGRRLGSHRRSVLIAGSLDVTVPDPSGQGRTHRAATRPGNGALTIYRDGSLVEVLSGGEALPHGGIQLSLLRPSPSASRAAACQNP